MATNQMAIQQGSTLANILMQALIKAGTNEDEFKKELRTTDKAHPMTTIDPVENDWEAFKKSTKPLQSSSLDSLENSSIRPRILYRQTKPKHLSSHLNNQNSADKISQHTDLTETKKNGKNRSKKLQNQPIKVFYRKTEHKQSTSTLTNQNQSISNHQSLGVSTARSIEGETPKIQPHILQNQPKNNLVIQPKPKKPTNPLQNKNSQYSGPQFSDNHLRW